MLMLLMIHRNQQVSIPKIRQEERNRYLTTLHTLNILRGREH